jgi:hypothetical protein
MLQVKIFEADSYQDLENKINAWLSDPENLKVITAHEFKIVRRSFYASYHWITQREYSLMQAQTQNPVRIIRQ